MSESSPKNPDGNASGLSRCLVESDAAAVAAARSTRRGALLVSLALEATILAALVLHPLLATGERLKPFQIVPIPPLPRAVRSSPEPSRGSSAANQGAPRQRPIYDWIYFPPTVPDRIPTEGKVGAEPPSVPDIGPGGEPSGIEGGLRRVGPADERAAPRLPASPTVRSKPVRQSEGVQEALLVRRIEPIYPWIAKQMHLEGMVKLRAVIGRDGTVNSLERLSGHPILAEAALEAVRQWRYRPTLLNGEPVEVESYVTVVFQIQH